MKCIYCGKEIKSSEKYELFGCDGDFIHVDCKTKQYQEMDDVCNMTDKQFYKWMIGD